MIALENVCVVETDTNGIKKKKTNKKCFPPLSEKLFSTKLALGPKSLGTKGLTYRAQNMWVAEHYYSPSLNKNLLHTNCSDWNKCPPYDL